MHSDTDISMPEWSVSRFKSDELFEPVREDVFIHRGDYVNECLIVCLTIQCLAIRCIDREVSTATLPIIVRRQIKHPLKVAFIGAT